MHYFLDPTFDINSGLLNEEESRHAIKSLRIKAGDEIEVGNGRGYRYQCKVITVGKKQLILQVESENKTEPPRYRHSIALAPTKNTSRFEWFLEKATEMGVDDIVALETKRTERTRINTDRAQRIILSAAKQSQRSYLPAFHGAMPFDKLIGEASGNRYIAHCDETYPRIPLDAIKADNRSENICILIGPEGDFTSVEIETAYATGFKGVRLGDNRLRTETAGVYSAAILSTWK